MLKLYTVPRPLPVRSTGRALSRACCRSVAARKSRKRSAVLSPPTFALPAGNPQLLLIGLGLLVGGGFAGPSGSVVADVTPAAIHASAFAVLTLANNIFGLAPGPFITGALADAFSLQTAMALAPLVGLGSAAAYWMASRFYLNEVTHSAS